MEAILLLGSIFPFLVVACVVIGPLAIRIIDQYEKGVIFTLGKYSRTAEPGLRFIVPFIQTCTKACCTEMD